MAFLSVVFKLSYHHCVCNVHLNQSKTMIMMILCILINSNRIGPLKNNVFLWLSKDKENKNVIIVQENSKEVLEIRCKILMEGKCVKQKFFTSSVRIWLFVENSILDRFVMSYQIFESFKYKKHDYQLNNTRVKSSLIENFYKRIITLEFEFL